MNYRKLRGLDQTSTDTSIYDNKCAKTLTPLVPWDMDGGQMKWTGVRTKEIVSVVKLTNPIEFIISNCS